MFDKLSPRQTFCYMVMALIYIKLMADSRFQSCTTVAILLLNVVMCTIPIPVDHIPTVGF